MTNQAIENNQPFAGMLARESEEATLQLSGRRYDLDWLRVIAFGLLILYHCGMYYVADWEWHIKSEEPSLFLQNLMLLTSPWRMSLLFLVSGAALYFACQKMNRSTLLRIRFKRLLLPLLFGMAVVVPPQLYIELMTSEGAQIDYGEFYALYLDAGTTAYPAHQHSPLGLWTWNHLWFLAYLWFYTLLFVLCRPLLDRAAMLLKRAVPGMFSIVALPIALLMLYRYLLADAYPPSNALFDDWYNHLRYVSFLFGGYLLAECAWFWEQVSRNRWQLLGGATCCYLALLLVFHGGVEVLFVGLPEPQITLVQRLIVSFDQWLWILALLGLGVHFLNTAHPVLRYMNTAILPWYILHQTFIVAIAYWLSDYHLPPAVEAVLLVTSTVAGCALGYELLRRIWLGRVLFGLK